MHMIIFIYPSIYPSIAAQKNVMSELCLLSIRRRVLHCFQAAAAASLANCPKLTAAVAKAKAAAAAWVAARPDTQF